MIRVLAVDDHAVVRAGLREFLKDAGDIEVAGEAANAVAALAELAHAPYDVVLLDISMPVQDGVETMKQIKREFPAVPVLVLSMHAESRYAVSLLRYGASGYLQKEALPTELVSAIRLVHRGRRYISPTLAELLASGIDIDDDDRPLHENLSERERHVFLSLAKGDTVTAIAADLKLSIKTVSTYRARLLEKMKATSNADLTYYAIKNNLLD